MNTEMILSQVTELNGEGRVVEALRILENARAAFPYSNPILLEYVSQLRKLGMNGEALREVNIWLRNHEDIPARLQKLAILRDVCIPKEAKKLAEGILLEDGDNCKALATLGWALMATGDVGRGMELLTETLASHPNDENVLFEFMNARLEAGDPTGATVALEKAVAAAPNDALLRVYLGRVYRMTGRLEEAREQAIKAEMLEGPSYRARYLLGRVDADLKNSTAALGIGAELVRRFPCEVGGHVILSCTYLGLGKIEAAVTSARSAMRVQPSNVAAEEAFRAAIRELPRRALPSLAWMILADAVGRIFRRAPSA